MKKKRILFVEQNQDGTIGGSHYSLFFLVKALDKAKYEPLVVFYEDNDMVHRFREECETLILKRPSGIRLEAAGPLLKYPCILCRKVYNGFHVSVAFFMKCLAFMIRNRIDMVHLNNTANVGWEWLFASRFLKRKCITHHRGFSRFSFLDRERAKYFDRIICISRAVEKSLVESRIANTTMIYNVIDIDEFKGRIKKEAAEVRKEFGVPASGPLVVMVGNIRRWKGQITVIRAVDLLVKKIPALKCLLVGDVSREDRDYFEEVLREIEQRELEETIFLAGYRSDIPDIINSCDVVIHSSIAPEPFGRVIIEGMSLGKPVIATDMGGAQEIIQNGISGFLVRPEDPDALAGRLAYLCNSPDAQDRVGKDSIKRVAEEFCISRFSIEINKLYDTILFSGK